jgi:uncharacterized membrane protein
LDKIAMPSPALLRHRWEAIDLARGIAILAMIVYHFGWDLSFLKLIELNVLALPVWRWFARAIAGSFLFLSGIGLVLAHGHAIRWRAFLRRLAIVGGAALLVTVATYFAFPDSFIFFGILHCIALSSVLALPFLRAPVALALAAAAFVLAGPWIFTDVAFDAPWLDWLGLGSFDPVTNDYVPIFPWFAFVLLGTVFARLMLDAKRPRLPVWQPKGGTSKAIIWAGRHSLPIYLLHQILLLGVLYGVLQLTGPNARAEARPFIAECEASCGRQGAQPATCRSLCSCVVDRLRQEPALWAKVRASDVDEEGRLRVSRLTQQCLRQAPS